MTLRVGSLFSGIGGMDAGLARAGLDHVFFCESDPWRREVLAARWPGVPIYDDVRAVREPAHVRRWEAGTGLLCGGFPCQDVSIAGKRRGLAGERTGLYFEAIRIIDAFRPRWVLLENVPGLLSSEGGRDFGVVLGTLADLGYGVGWRVLDSRFFGVPQRRRRVFIVGTLADGDPRAAAERAGQVLAVGSRCPGHPATSGEAREDVTAASPVSTLTSSKAGGWRIGADEAAGGQLVNLDSGVRRLTPRECERLQALPDDWTCLDDKTPDSRRYSALGDAVTANVAEWIGHRLCDMEKVA